MRNRGRKERNGMKGRGEPRVESSRKECPKECAENEEKTTNVAITTPLQPQMNKKSPKRRYISSEVDEDSFTRRSWGIAY